MMMRRVLFGAVTAALTILSCGIAMAQTAPGKDIVTTAVDAGSFKTLAAAIQAAGLVDSLKGKGPFTVFAPTDEAFEKLPEGTVAMLLKPENKQKLIAILTFHVVPGKVMSADVLKLNSAATLNGQQVDIKVDGGTVHVGQAKVTATDISCTNGVIHVIDTVLLPPAAPAKGAQITPSSSGRVADACSQPGSTMTNWVNVSRRRSARCCK